MSPAKSGADEDATRHWYPVDLSRARDKRHYLTGQQALNLWDRASGADGGTADWHEPGALWSPRPNDRGEHAGITVTVPYATLGEDGVEDAREALHGTGHPGAHSPVPLWKATHARAIVDLAFHRCRRGERTLRAASRFGPVARWTVADWLWSEAQMRTVQEYAARAEAEVDAADRAWWRAWWEGLRFGASHEDYLGGCAGTLREGMRAKV